MPKINSNGLMTVGQVAGELKMSPATVRRYANGGDLKIANADKIGKVAKKRYYLFSPKYISLIKEIGLEAANRAA